MLGGISEKGEGHIYIQNEQTRNNNNNKAISMINKDGQKTKNQVK